MKYFKIFALLLCPVAVMTSCSSSDDKPSINTASNVTVSMQEADITFMESDGIVQVPVTLTGEANGYVTVTCEVQEYGSSPAMSDVHYLMTSQTLTIAPGDKTGYFELKTVDDFEINDPRFFTITLKTIQGGTIGEPSTTIVQLDDNDRYPYDRLAGTWIIEGEAYGGGPASATVNLVPYKHSELGYKHAYQMTGFGELTNITVGFTVNDITEEGYITIEYGQGIGTTADGYAIELYGLNGNSIVSKGTLKFVWNEDFTELNIDGKPGSLAALYNDGEYYYLYKVVNEIVSMHR